MGGFGLKRGLGREGGGSVSEVVRFWEGEEACGAGLAMEKVALEEWGAEGFRGGF